MDPEPVRSVDRPPGHPARLRWRALSDGLIVSLLITGPSLMAALILRDQHQPAWKALLVLAALGFLAGGAVAGRHRRKRAGALWQGAVLGGLTVLVILVANAVRVGVVGDRVAFHTVGLWVGIGASSIVIASIGAVIGRNRYLHSRRKLGTSR